MHLSIDFLKMLDIENKYIVVGCSGGPDSMCLLNILLGCHYKIVCAHINHNIRKESFDEEKFLMSFCKKECIPFEVLELPKDGPHDEAYYRKKRYEFYRQVADKYETDIISTAHHGDDLVETILMRLSRGSNLKGYIGFKKDYYDRGYRFIKPLIFYTKKDIIDYDTVNKIEYVHDYTNDLDKYTRNRYRHHILPFLKSENKDIHKKYLYFSEELEETSTFIENLVASLIEENYKDEELDVSKFLELDPFIQKKELEKIIGNIYKDDVDKLKVFHIKEVLRQLNRGGNFKLNLPLGFIARREYNKFKIGRPKSFKEYMIELGDKITLPNGDTIEIVESSSDTSNRVTRLNTSNLKMPLYIRTRKSGDRMQIKNMEGSKKVKYIMIDAKVEPSLRDTLPILVDSEDNILWIPNLRKSKFDNEIDEKYDIILKYTKKGR